MASNFASPRTQMFRRMKTSGALVEYSFHSSLQAEKIYKLSELKIVRTKSLVNDGMALMGLPEGFLLPKVDLVDELRMYDELTRWLNVQMILPQVLIALLIVAYTNICFDSETLYFEDSVLQCPDAIYLKGCSWFLYLIFFQRLCTFYAVEAEKEMLKWGFINRWQAFMTSGIGWFFLEALVNAVIPFPGMEGLNIESSIFFVFVFFRAYLLIRLARDFSTIWIQRHHIQRLSEFRDKGPVDTYTVLVAFFHSHSLASIVFLFTFGIGILAYTLHQMERHLWVAGNFDYWDMQDMQKLPPEDEGWDPSPYSSYSSCYWFGIVTSSTVGYGDMAPRTPAGRFVAAFMILFGLTMTSLLSGVVINYLEPTIKEEAVLLWNAHVVAAKEMRESAARVIQKSWKAAKHYRIKYRLNDASSQNKTKLARKRRNNIARIIRPDMQRLRHARKRFEQSMEEEELPMKDMVHQRCLKISGKMDRLEDILRSRHPNEMARAEEEEYNERLNGARFELMEVLRIKREVEKLRNSAKMQMRKLTLDARSSRSRLRQGSISYSRSASRV